MRQTRVMTGSHDQRSPEPDRAGRRLLGASALGALNTLNAAKPFARSGPAAIPSFFAGWLTSELPLHTIGVQALGAAHLLRRGALRRPSGWLGLGMTAASWVGLWDLWRQAMGQNEIFERALRDASPDALEVGPPPSSEGAEVVIDQRRIAAGPLQRRRRRYVEGPSHSYGAAGRRNHLDIWRRSDLPADGRAPVLLQVHGGGWILGSKDQQAQPLMAHMADAGWVCVSINYRL